MSYLASRVTLLRKVTCQTFMPGDAVRSTDMPQGNIIGNVMGHGGGVEVVERNGLVSLFLRTSDYHQVWKGIPRDALEIIKLEV